MESDCPTGPDGRVEHRFKRNMEIGAYWRCVRCGIERTKEEARAWIRMASARQN
jgi:hypothetical protein